MGLREKVLFVLVLALAAGMVGYSLLGPGGGKQAQLQTELSRLQAENLALEEENRRLALEVEALRNRPDVQERVAREELGLVKPDEIIIRLPPAADGGQAAPADPR